MSTFKQTQIIGFKEYVALMALLTALTALTIDTILPALPMIANDLDVVGENHVQYVISFLFAGLTLGQLVYGPISDSLGRKKTIYIGLAVFVAGSFISLFATNFTLMLIGRVMQGFGAASPRIVSIAMTRDLYEGRNMARVTSYIMGVFILVPVLAPALGQLILMVTYWRAIFALFVLCALGALVWIYTRLPESLPVEHRRRFGFAPIWTGARDVMRNKTTMGYTVCAGLVFGALIGYVSSAQQIFQDHYNVGEWFPLYFAISALSIGAASFFNSAIVIRFGMRRICHYALMGIMTTSSLFLLVSMAQDYNAPLWEFMIFAPVTFFCIGLLFGNFNAIAMEPMGHMAGIASALIGFYSSVISLVIGTVIGQSYNGTLIPILTGFLCLSVSAFLIQSWLNRQPPQAVPV